VTLVVAHRGAPQAAPENTMPAFELAVAQGADAVELDVHLTADGELAVIHDDTLDRTTDRSGRVAALTMGEIRAADAGARFAGEDGSYPYRGRGIGVPTLAQVLEWLPDGIGLVVEIKAAAAVDAAVQVLLRHPASRDGRIGLISFDEHAADRARELGPALATGVLLVPFADFDEGMRRTASRGHFGVDPWEGDLGTDPASRVAEATRYGLRVGCYVVNDPDRMKELAGAGLWGFVTDRPDVGRAALGRPVGG
jgi:glycerophosphoryl diester phosphodiesterase